MANQGNSIRVSSRAPLFFYVGLGKRLLAEHGEVHLSALGFAVSTVVTVAELLKKDKLAVEVQLGTCLEALTDDGKARPVHKPKLMIVLRKAPDFDKIMAEQAKEREARQEARAAQQVSQQAPAQ
uniref:DNA/RNA-binding protein Alba-like domain-containing protein n=1 Tax=Dunaliella tertiolecta TaxID=3047 RepID=A0A7S3RAA8_DUNTE|mmetsp:Transcript_19644/g.54797  ORF Transcript_19644/g.54797 Transcript_19644/m.54797 type:complete len:125 (-) Transcript_19644:228-602(-)|eukprot:CAMPEP_0202340874 /NCGR_PEP_ID=MMETSP1126-20121109/2129_1 /ASSEMBLY_ACC=CAM_ASM_000457 /TAXON_ID=3047 /ORGANISM="Dunaliella tertiolecta, Strain CCMP1320" /LENGTH=124 /DNA_ID=CAMNT_0048931647 /DNA_START=105 /DNA_END=479 /DNA_ORIENTATION=+